MKRLFYFSILSFFWFSSNAQTVAKDTIGNDLAIPKKDTNASRDYNAEDLPWHGRRFKVTVGGFFPVNNTQVQVGNNNGNLGTNIDLEDDLGFSKASSSFIGAFEWRISRRSRLDLEFFSLNRTATHKLEKDITFGDHLYDINTRVSAFFDTQITKVSYGYAFLSKPKYEAGLLVGAHVLFGDLGLRLEAEQASIEIKDNFDYTAPLPDIGIWGEFVLNKRFGLYTNVNYLALKIGDINGRIMSYNLSLSYNVVNNFSLTAGYTGLNFKVDTERKHLNGFLKWGYNGPSITATYSFGKHIQFF